VPGLGRPSLQFCLLWMKRPRVWVCVLPPGLHSTPALDWTGLDSVLCCSVCVRVCICTQQQPSRLTHSLSRSSLPLSLPHRSPFSPNNPATTHRHSYTHSIRSTAHQPVPFVSHDSWFSIIVFNIIHSLVRAHTRPITFLDTSHLRLASSRLTSF
jgi:hypothetical protein